MSYEEKFVCVSINKSNAVSGSYYGKVMSRGRVSETMLANRMKEASCGLNEALIQYVLSLFSDAVLEYVSSGYIVDMAGLGSMFLSVKGEVGLKDFVKGRLEKDGLKNEDVTSFVKGASHFSFHFTPSKALKRVLENNVKVNVVVKKGKDEACFKDESEVRKVQGAKMKGAEKIDAKDGGKIKESLDVFNVKIDERAKSVMKDETHVKLISSFNSAKHKIKNKDAFIKSGENDDALKAMGTGSVKNKVKKEVVTSESGENDGVAKDASFGNVKVGKQAFNEERLKGHFFKRGGEKKNGFNEVRKGLSNYNVKVDYVKRKEKKSI